MHILIVPISNSFFNGTNSWASWEFREKLLEAEIRFVRTGNNREDYERQSDGTDAPSVASWQNFRHLNVTGAPELLKAADALTVTLNTKRRVSEMFHFYLSPYLHKLSYQGRLMNLRAPH